jgi:hypothetical protein
MLKVKAKRKARVVIMARAFEKSWNPVPDSS